MRSLSARLKRMEKTLLDPGTCQCGGPGRVRIWMGDEPEPTPCERCGTSGTLVHLIRDVPPEPEEDSTEVA